MKSANLANSVWRMIRIFLILACALMEATDQAQQSPQSVALFKNVRVFNGKGTSLSAPTNVLVRGNKIERISSAPVAVDLSANRTIINGNGRGLS